jgi:hypothetical protein
MWPVYYASVDAGDAAHALSLARTAIDDPEMIELPEGYDTKTYVLEQIDAAITLIEPEEG